LAGCAPAEPASVWPGAGRIPREAEQEQGQGEATPMWTRIKEEEWWRQAKPGKGEKKPRVVRG
jgi:hypothetical protein